MRGLAIYKLIIKFFELGNGRKKHKAVIWCPGKL